MTKLEALRNMERRSKGSLLYLVLLCLMQIIAAGQESLIISLGAGFICLAAIILSVLFQLMDNAKVAFGLPGSENYTFYAAEEPSNAKD